MKQVVDKWRKAIRKADSVTVFKRAIIENREEILDLNVAQLRQGKDSLGEFLDEYASEDYARMKQSEGSQAPFGIADLILEGDFTEGFVLKYEGGGEFTVTSTDSKTNELMAKYGDQIFGLQAKSISELTQDIAEFYINIFRNELL